MNILSLFLLGLSYKEKMIHSTGNDLNMYLINLCHKMQHLILSVKFWKSLPLCFFIESVKTKIYFNVCDGFFLLQILISPPITGLRWFYGIFLCVRLLKPFIWKYANIYISYLSVIILFFYYVLTFSYSYCYFFFAK